MGTRRSRHNKGRKPLYKEHRRDLIEFERSAGLADRMSANTRAASPEMGRVFPFSLPEGGLESSLDPPSRPASVGLAGSNPVNTQAGTDDSEAAHRTNNCAGSIVVPVIPPDLPDRPSLDMTYPLQVCRFCGGPCSWASKTRTCRACFKMRPYPRPNLGKFSPCVGEIKRDPRTATQILATANNPGGHRWRSLRWKPAEESILATLIDAAADPEKAADVLWRDPKALANRARDRGLTLPDSWAALLPYAYVPKGPAERLLHFPYIRKERPEHADLLRVNDLVPRAFPEHMRADIVQSIMLALFEGTVTMADLERNRAKLTFFIKRFRKEQEPYREVIGYGADQDESRPYEDIAAAAKMEWRENEIRETRGNFTAMFRYAPPTQIDSIFVKQVVAHYKAANEAGRVLSIAEAYREMS